MIYLLPNFRTLTTTFSSHGCSAIYIFDFILYEPYNMIHGRKLWTINNVLIQITSKYECFVMPNTTSGLHKFVLTLSARLDGIIFIYLLTFYRLSVSHPTSPLLSSFNVIKYVKLNLLIRSRLRITLFQK